ncbi:DUF3037 domain-containing protein [Listeria monocytogenes]|nr:DUF3037 domain-containing protein [Listeria monocytogenes]EFR8992917.1 DUF3037 domain-containing protein [Listeria monocytogenes]EHP8495335.1 DUF3037 domain-containing protein [Listeria monocytogenes]EKN7353227.1 DUF3037 domain-containing protein [Listeria monocytogenes]EKZ4625947.1 DUF3037 domain-containing protein [Listeria monocytogenes]
MGNLKLNYAVLQYMPDPIRREAINVGIAFHCASTEWSQFYYTKNKSRIRSFDDEYDKEYIEMMFDSFDYEFNSQTISEYPERFNSIKDDDFLKENIKFYVNEFRFLPVESIQTTDSNFWIDIRDIESTFLYYDKPKGERISSKEVRDLLKKRLTNYNIKNQINNLEVKCDFGSKKIFDFMYEKNIFKAISFDKQKSGLLANELKIVYYDILNNRGKLDAYKINIIVDNSIMLNEKSVNNSDIFREFKEKITNEIENVNIYTLSDFGERVISNNF